jgi:hypothetical protein
MAGAPTAGTVMKRVWLVFAVLAGVIMGPLWRPGYILTLDMAWPEHIPWRPELTNLFPLHAILYGLNQFLPSMVLQKAILAGCFLMAGVGAFRLARGQTSQLAAYAAGLIYVVNPFTYTRLMMGQWLVLLGYAILPWLVRSLVTLLERPGFWSSCRLSGWLVLLGLISIHDVGLAAVLIVAVTLAWSWGHWRRLGVIARWLGLVAVVWTAAESFWFIPLLMGRSAMAQDIAGFGADQLHAYAPSGGTVGVPLNVLALQGAWTDRFGRYTLPSDTGWLFWLAFAGLMVLVGLGLVMARRRSDRLAWGLAAAGLVGWVLATGLATTALANSLPLFRGYRDPQKWAALLALADAYLVAQGLEWWRQKRPDWMREGAGLAVLLTLAWTPLLLWGAAGQLQSVPYPASWAEAAHRLDTVPGQFKVLLLPWHQYLYLDFVQRVVAWPGGAFGHHQAITSDNPELPGVWPRSSQPDNDAIERHVLAMAYSGQTAGAQLSALGIRYVVLLKQADWADYDWLQHQDRLKLVGETTDWQLYQVKESP